jgi:hypothetical protein
MSAAALASLILNKRRATSPGKVSIFIKVKLYRAQGWVDRLRSRLLHSARSSSR